MPTAAIANAVPLDWSHGLDTKPLPGFSPDDAGELIGNEMEAAMAGGVFWEAWAMFGPRHSASAGRPAESARRVSLRFPRPLLFRRQPRGGLYWSAKPFRKRSVEKIARIVALRKNPDYKNFSH